MKRIITLTLAVLLAVTAFAQNLEGTWSYTGNKNEKMNGENNVNGELKAVTTVTLTFSGAAFECTRKADVRMDMVLDQNDPDDSTVGLLVKLNGKNAGSFELADGVLKLIPNKGKPQVDVKTDVEGCLQAVKCWQACLPDRSRTRWSRNSRRPSSTRSSPQLRPSSPSRKS